jgi:hypothetical protein
MATPLISYLQVLPDVRSDLGKRYRLDDLLIMIILGMLSGCYGYRELGTFVKANRAVLVDLLGLKRNAVPSHVTIRTVMLGLDFAAVAASFHHWIAERLEVAPGDVFSIDGKALAATVSDAHGAMQAFQCFLSVYSQRHGVVHSLQRYEHGHSGEIPVLQQLIATLDLKGVTLSVDALHCQKKQSQ